MTNDQKAFLVIGHWCLDILHHSRVSQEGNMEIKTYRAKSMQQALKWIRSDLGADAAVLHTREVAPPLWGLLGGDRHLEVTAGIGVNVPSRFSNTNSSIEKTVWPQTESSPATEPIPPAHEQDYGAKYREDLQHQVDGLQSLVEDLCRQSDDSVTRKLTPELAELLTELMDSELGGDLARELIDRLRSRTTESDWHDPHLLRARLSRMVEEEIQCCGPIQLSPGSQRVVALIGPTGVGKTTTIAKLAADFHLRQQRRVGLLTVDTYRIAAVDQLRTYADIIDLPMEVVSTPREMRTALAQLADCELVLMDTAGRSPCDSARIQELKSLLFEAQADEVHLVVSGVSTISSLKNTVSQFSTVGATGLLVTKLDEVTGLGNLLHLLRGCRLPLSYVTDGQSVPEDISPADARKLARRILHLEGGR
jgi:flagellar biosynthesis protein FlhF